MDLQKTKDIVAEITLRAGEILEKHFDAQTMKHFQKEGVDFTTEADREVDQFLINSLKEKFPETYFLTEETSSGDYSEFKEKSNVWVIDPLDGTINFSRKNPNFAISIALVSKGRPRLGVVYLPIKKDLYWATENSNGAFKNGEKIAVSKTKVLREVVIACDWGWDLEKRLMVVEWLGKIVTRVRQVKCLGSAASDMSSLAEGKIDLYINAGLKPWDMAAAALIIEKAGGRITKPDGSDWNIFNSEILVSNNILHEQALDLIKTEEG